jgi:hypothetical protein
MRFDDFEHYLASLGLQANRVDQGGQPYLVIQDFEIPDGTHAGENCDVAILASSDTPWVAPPAIHVKPHLVTMGQQASQPSPLGPDWQYLSRRFEPAPQPRTFHTHILTVLGEL